MDILRLRCFFGTPLMMLPATRPNKHYFTLSRCSSGFSQINVGKAPINVVLSRLELDAPSKVRVKKCFFYNAPARALTKTRGKQLRAGFKFGKSCDVTIATLHKSRSRPINSMVSASCGPCIQYVAAIRIGIVRQRRISSVSWQTSLTMCPME